MLVFKWAQNLAIFAEIARIDINFGPESSKFDVSRETRWAVAK
jgi:hypothetical protein